MNLSKDPPSGRVPLKWIELFGLVAVLGIAVWIYRGAFQGFFAKDDYGWLESSRFQGLGDYIKIFFRFNPALSYRPLGQETIRVDTEVLAK